MTIFDVLRLKTENKPCKTVRQEIVSSLAHLGFGQTEMATVTGYARNTIAVDCTLLNLHTKKINAKINPCPKERKKIVETLRISAFLDHFTHYLHCTDNTENTLSKSHAPVMIALATWLELKKIPHIYRIRMEYLDELAQPHYQNKEAIQNLLEEIGILQRATQISLVQEDIEMHLHTKLAEISADRDESPIISKEEFNYEMLQSTRSRHASLPIHVCNSKETKERVEYALNLLNKTEQKVLRLLFFEKKSFNEIGDQLRLSTQRISQIRFKAMRKLRHRSRFWVLTPIVKKIGDLKTEDLVSEKEQERSKILKGPLYDRAQKALAEKLSIPLKNLDISFGTSDRLQRLDLKTIGNLQGKTEEELLKIKNFGPKSIRELQHAFIKLELKEGFPFMDN